MTIHVITLWRVSVTSLTTSVSTMRFVIKNVNFEGDKISFQKGHMINNLTLAVVSYEIYETRRRLVS